MATGVDTSMPMAYFGPEGLFWICSLLTAIFGVALALLDNSEIKGRGGISNPTSHVADCMYEAEFLFSDGVGLGVLEPLWRIFTVDGVLWTLVRGWAPRDEAKSLGLGGLLAAVSAIVSAFGDAFCALLRLCSRRGSEANKPRDKPMHKEVHMSLRVELHAYWGYATLFILGVFREYVIRIAAYAWRDPMAQRFLTREKWSSGWVDFYLQHMYRPIVDCFSRPISSAPDACVDVIKRKRPSSIIFGPLHDPMPTEEVQRCLNLSSYNYLGFGGVDEFCTPIAKDMVLEQGFSSGGTRIEGGTLPVHRALELQVARYLGKEDALVLGMGFATNSTIIPALFENGGQGVLIISDELNHRSIVEGVRLSGATVRAFPHNCMPSLETELSRAVQEGQPGGTPWRKIFILVEGIYSMEGDFCRLREIVTLKNRYKAYLYLDEAHSIGAVGTTGRGVTELLGVPTDEVDVMMGTFTKSFGSAGGYVASSKAVIDALRQTAPGSLYAAAMSPPCAAQALAAFRLIEGSIGGTVGAEKLAQIRDNANFFRTRMEEEGFKVLGDVDSPIIPVMLHHPQKMASFSRKCLDHGIAVVIVGYPAVPVLYERVRFCISAAHTREQLTRAIDDIVKIGREVGIMYSTSLSPAEIASREASGDAYNNKLREAPLERAGQARPANEVVAKWAPEPLAPKTSSSSISMIALRASTDANALSGPDFRRFDPLGYLGKATPEMRTAAETTLNCYGFGACGPRGFYGGSRPHLDLEVALAKSLGVQAAIAYSSGVTTASSVLPALVQRGDRVIIESDVHLGMRSGLRLCKAEITWVQAGDMAALEAALSKAADSDAKKKGKPVQRRTFVVAEAMSQRTGHIAPLVEIISLKEKYGAMLILDESLSFGVLGKLGRGLFEHSGVDPGHIDAIIGSLEHSVAGVGGYCAGHRDLVEHQRLAGAGYCFSAACPPAACSVAMAVIEDIMGEGGAARRAKLTQNTKLLRETLSEAVSQSKAPLKLVSSAGSYVQHLQWTGEESAAECEKELAEVAQHCASSCSVGIQVCSPSLCCSEAAYGARLGSTTQQMPSLRFCASSTSTDEDIHTLRQALVDSFANIK